MLQDLLNAIHAGWDAFWAIPHIRVWLIVGWLTYLVWLGGWIVLQKREPAATLSWLMSLAFLPYLGFLIYYLLGPQKSSGTACAVHDGASHWARSTMKAAIPNTLKCSAW